MLSPISQAVERGSTRLAVEDASKFKEGDRVRIYVNESPEAAERPKSGGWTCAQEGCVWHMRVAFRVHTV